MEQREWGAESIEGGGEQEPFKHRIIHLLRTSVCFLTSYFDRNFVGNNPPTSISQG